MMDQTKEKTVGSAGTATCERGSAKACSADLLNELLRGVKMGSDAILTLLPKTDNAAMKSGLTEQLARYEDFAARATAMLAKRDAPVKETSAVSKWAAKMGVTMNTLTDTSASHLADLLIQGNTMGITDLLSALHEAERRGCEDKEALDLAREVLAFEERSQETLKRYL